MRGCVRIFHKYDNANIFRQAPTHLANIACPANYAGNVDDAAGQLLLLHQACCSLGHQEGSLQVDVDHLMSQCQTIVRLGCGSWLISL